MAEGRHGEGATGRHENVAGNAEVAETPQAPELLVGSHRAEKLADCRDWEGGREGKGSAHRWLEEDLVGDRGVFILVSSPLILFHKVQISKQNSTQFLRAPNVGR